MIIFVIFRIEFLLGPTAILALVLNHEFTFMEILWTFSIYLESVAILPQLFMVQKTGEAESITSHYLFALGSYRALYILNWIYRYYFEGKCFFDCVMLISNWSKKITSDPHGNLLKIQFPRKFSFCS